MRPRRLRGGQAAQEGASWHNGQRNSMLMYAMLSQQCDSPVDVRAALPSCRTGYAAPLVAVDITPTPSKITAGNWA